MIASKTLSIITCTYFNEHSIPALYSAISVVEQQLLARGVGVELIYVEDGSGDNSLQELLKIKSQRPQTKVISHARNFGAVAALKTGFQFVTDLGRR